VHLARSARRVAVLSDVHGNALALAAVLAEVNEASPDLIVFGGDLTWGPLPEETLRLVDALSIPALFVRGNAERTLLEPDEEPTERADWLREHHSPTALTFLATFAEQLSIEIEGLGRVRFCHGSPRSDEELVTPETAPERIRAAVAGVEERTIVSAHTHLQFDRRVAGVRSINPGSVGMPYEGRPGAFWALLGPDVELRRADYDVAAAVNRYRESGDPLADRMIDILEQPPTREEVTAHAEQLEFSG
jgi:putative phosphoesterase